MSKIYIENSKNYKLGNADTTYMPVSKTLCRECPFLEAGCYANLGYMRKHNQTLGNDFTAKSAALAEANAIRSSYNGGEVPNRFLRLHTSGDIPTNEGAKIVAKAVSEWQVRGGLQAWTYTHQWKKVHRSSWGVVSVLASVEKKSDYQSALEKGYGLARVVEKHVSPKAKLEDGIRWIPCPQQTLNITCDKCKLCFDTDKLNASKSGVEFEAHGVQRKKMLKVIQ